ncbi:MAG: hypothetical protein V2B18_03735 [Pseudomonadota bacterium]
MNYSIMVTSGFMGFALALGSEVLVFYLLGYFFKIPRNRFTRCFVLAGVVAFSAIYLYLHYKTKGLPPKDGLAFLSGCVGGWLGGIFFGLMQFKPYLLKLLR